MTPRDTSAYTVTCRLAYRTDKITRHSTLNNLLREIRGRRLSSGGRLSVFYTKSVESPETAITTQTGGLVQKEPKSACSGQSYKGKCVRKTKNRDNNVLYIFGRVPRMASPFSNRTVPKFPSDDDHRLSGQGGDGRVGRFDRLRVRHGIPPSVPKK